jgi:ribosome-associated protein
MRFSLSGGPGGQHANKTSTRVELTWDVDSSSVLGPRQRQAIRNRLKGRIDSSGVLRVVVDTHRSQMRNREEAVRKLGGLVEGALRRRPTRVATGPTRASKERRLEAKKRRSDIKRGRQDPTRD